MIGFWNYVPKSDLKNRPEGVIMKWTKLLTNIMLCCTQSDGGTYNVQTGRRDGLVSLASNVDLPPPFISVSDSIAAFAAKGLNVTDMVYLLGNLPLSQL